MLSLALVALFASITFAGPGDGGGGQGVVCRNADNSIKPVELLDLWEAREIYKRPALASNASVEEQVAANIARLRHLVHYPRIWGQNGKVIPRDKAFMDALEQKVWCFLSENCGMIKRFYGKRLTKTNDAFEEVVPDDENCSVEQLVRYKDIGGSGSSEILMNQALVDKMDNTNKAALYLHEALYAVLREFGEKNSLRTRRAVGIAMSGGEFKSLETFIKGPRIVCRSAKLGDPNPTEIYFVTIPEGAGVTAIPTQVNGMLVTGFSQVASYTPITIEEFAKRMKNGFSASFGNGYSKVDFDLSGIIKFHNKRPAEMTLLGSTNGITTGTSQSLLCDWEK